MLPIDTIFKFKVALVKAAQAGRYLVPGTRAYRRAANGDVVPVKSMGVYARKTLEEYQRRHGLKPTGILDAPTRAKLIPAAPAPTGPAHGIDVSDFQPVVDYAGLKRAGLSYVFAKATEGHTFEAHTYSRHRAGATNAGLVFGAYHFARPRPGMGDGAAQARRFLAVAKPRKGDLFPVLDLEVNDGVSPAAMAAWTRSFVDEVKRQCGGCIIYTGPYFWNDRVGSRAFGDCPLWVAHYTSHAPMIPMSWHSYALWQYTSSGHEPGTAGRLDLDVSSAAGIAHLRIA